MKDDNELEFETEDEQPADTIKNLREKLKRSQTERQEYLDTSQRLRADYLNLRRETEANRQDLLKFANEKLLLEIIAVLDNFEQAFGHEADWQGLPDEWRRGMEQIYNKLVMTVKNYGVENSEPALHQPFDPSLAQAVGTIDTTRDEDDNMVLEVVQKGYVLHDKVIRPASVRVGRKV